MKIHAYFSQISLFKASCKIPGHNLLLNDVWPDYNLNLSPTEDAAISFDEMEDGVEIMDNYYEHKVVILLPLPELQHIVETGCASALYTP